MSAEPARLPPAEDPDAGSDEILQVPLDRLVDFLNDFFAAMDALHGPDGAPGRSAEGR